MGKTLTRTQLFLTFGGILVFLGFVVGMYVVPPPRVAATDAFGFFRDLRLSGVDVIVSEASAPNANPLPTGTEYRTKAPVPYLTLPTHPGFRFDGDFTGEVQKIVREELASVNLPVAPTEDNGTVDDWKKAEEARKNANADLLLVIDGEDRGDSVVVKLTLTLRRKVWLLPQGGSETLLQLPSDIKTFWVKKADVRTAVTYEVREMLRRSIVAPYQNAHSSGKENR